MEETLQEQADEIREGSYERGQRSYELYYSLHAITPFRGDAPSSFARCSERLSCLLFYRMAQGKNWALLEADRLVCSGRGDVFDG